MVETKAFSFFIRADVLVNEDTVVHVHAVKIMTLPLDDVSGSYQVSMCYPYVPLLINNIDMVM